MNFYSPKEIANNCVSIGKTKANLSVLNMFVSGILAGMFIGLAGMASTLAGVNANNPVTAKLLGALLFPGGLAMVLLAGSELFTGNSLMIVALLEKQITVSKLLKNWFTVYLGNLVGGILIAFLAVSGHCYNLFDNSYAISVISTASSKCSLTFMDAVIKGILCNMLVCIAVWISFGAKDVTGKVAGIFFPVAFFVFCGFEHSVADMYFLFAGLFSKGVPAYLSAANSAGISTGLINISHILMNCLIPVTIGNIIGGCFIGFMYWIVYLHKQ